MFDGKRRLGITMRTIDAQNYYEPRYALAHFWPKFLAAALPDADWLFVPSLGAEETINYCEKWDINGLIFTGGENVGSSPLRDQSEYGLIMWASRKSLPVLGICRGLQIMSMYEGAHLVQRNNHASVRHSLQGEYNWEVNSYHTAVLLEVPQQYTVLAKAEDGTIEAIRHDVLNWEGWMWHPEREPSYSPHDIRQVRKIFQ